MIVSKVSDQFINVTIVLEFSKWFTQLHANLHFLSIELVIELYVKRTVHRQDFDPKFNLRYGTALLYTHT